MSDEAVLERIAVAIQQGFDKLSNVLANRLPIEGPIKPLDQPPTPQPAVTPKGKP